MIARRYGLKCRGYADFDWNNPGLSRTKRRKSRIVNDRADLAAFARNDGQFEVENGPRANASTKLPHNSRDFANEMSPLGACVAGANIIRNVPPKPKAGVFQWKT